MYYNICTIFKWSYKIRCRKGIIYNKWNFVFMGANIDSVAEASSLGISARHAADYSADKAGVQTSFAKMEAAVNDVRETGSVSEDWKK